MDHSLLAVLLLAAGLCLLVLEVFIPSGGVIFVISAVCLSVSFFMAWKAWYVESPGQFGLYLTSVIILIPASLATAFYLFPKTPFGKRILLDAPTQDEVDAYAEERTRLQKLVGQQGISVSPLMPGGVIRIDHERYEATSEGVLLDAGMRIVVTGVRGITLIVREDTSSPEESATTFDDDLLADDNAVDFDVPES